ncbi:MAG TPA: D-cysteine desulfhydrase family protein [Vicinamibacterales bacterium]|nr:D-cysteine desulfhydrase family protein [Vicinamibacterales bacterium]
MTPDDLRARLARFPALPLVPRPSLVEPMDRLAADLGRAPRLVVKRDDAIAFGFGGNKVRKLAFVGARAQADGADTLVTAGGVQSNHARVTAAVAARLGMRAVLVANGTPPERPTANALLDRLLDATVVYVPSREARAAAIHEQAYRMRSRGGRPYEIPIGASIPLGALGFVAAVVELLDQMPPPDVIVHSTSSGGTQAGLVAACRLLRLPTRVIGVSADAPAAELAAQVEALVRGVGDLLGAPADAGTTVEVDDRFVGEGYGIPTDESTAALERAARTEALFLDPTYTAKAMAGLLAYVRERRFDPGQTIVFWHTGGQVGLFA